MTDPELEPGVATEIYRLGYTAGQRSMSGDAKVLRDEWWLGYSAGLVDGAESRPEPDEIDNCEPRFALPDLDGARSPSEPDGLLRLCRPTGMRWRIPGGRR